MPKAISDERRERNRRIRIAVYGGLLASLWGFYVWQPWEYDFIPRRLPTPNPPVDPNSTFLLSGRAKVLVVTAHPDDSAFFIGGTLARLNEARTEIHQVICTDGDKGYYPFEDWQWNRRTRRQEALSEARWWGGVDVLFLGLPDGRLRNNEYLVGRIAAALERVKPDYLLCFDPAYPDRFSHRDHRRAGEAAFEAATKTRIPKWVLMFQTIAPNFVMDISDYWDAKRDLLQMHASQFHGPRLVAITNMVGNRAERAGAGIGVSMGEGYRCVRFR